MDSWQELCHGWPCQNILVAWWLIFFMLDGKRPARLVFSTDHGRVCAVCELPIGDCTCRAGALLEAGGDGFVRLRRETQGRVAKL